MSLGLTIIGILNIRKMSVDSLLSCRKKVVQIEPEHYCRRLGQPCEACHLNLSHEKCISLCKCYLFCHQSCFVAQLQPILRSENLEIKCKTCHQSIQANLEATYVYEPQKTPEKIGKLLFSLCLLLGSALSVVLTADSSLRADLAFVLLYVQGLMIGLSLYWLVVRVRLLLYRKDVRVKEVVSTRLQIQTSAFKDIEIGTNEEITKDYLIFDSKKERTGSQE